MADEMTGESGVSDATIDGMKRVNEMAKQLGIPPEIIESAGIDACAFAEHFSNLCAMVTRRPPKKRRPSRVLGRIRVLAHKLEVVPT